MSWKFGSDDFNLVYLFGDFYRFHPFKGFKGFFRKHKNQVVEKFVTFASPIGFGGHRSNHLKRGHLYVGGWTNPFEKHARQNWIPFPQGLGWN